MFTSPALSLHFEHFQIEILHTNTIINIFPPWTYIISFGSCLLYLILITTIFPLFKSTFNHSFAKIHYTLLFLYSLFSFVAVLVYIIQTDEITNWSALLCAPIPPWLRLLSITFTISKIREWFDTAILISKRYSLSKIGFLHIYHHATTFLLFLCVMNFPGGEKNGILLNGFVHTLMYYHFAFRLPKLLRPMITTLQIIQLFTVTYIWRVVPNLCPLHTEFPSKNFSEYLVPYALVPVCSLFFLKFFIEQYLLSSKDKFSSLEEDEKLLRFIRVHRFSSWFFFFNPSN